MKKIDKEIEALTAAACEARKRAQAPYSNFRVGAALQAVDGRIFTGCNIESSSYGLTICAERVALCKALSEGALEFARLLVVTDTDPPASPCGACRQLLWDYAPGIDVIMLGRSGHPVIITLEELLPRAFGKEAFKPHQ
jgi:cytidine deaminase